MQKNNLGDKKACRYYSVKKVLSNDCVDGRIYVDRHAGIARAEKHGVRRAGSPEYGMFFALRECEARSSARRSLQVKEDS